VESIVSSSELPYLTIAEAAEFLRTTEKAVRRLRERRQLPGIRRRGRRLLVCRADLVRWLEESSVPSPQEE